MRLAVCGAGPAGLVVAGILSRATRTDASPLFNIDVFERDLLARGQGAGWDIDENAQKIFERAGLDWCSIVREGSDTWRIFRVGDDHTDAEPVAMLTPPNIMKRLGAAENKPESNRAAMREGLLNALSDNVAVHFGVRILGAEATEGNNCITLHGKEGRGGVERELGTYDLCIDASGMFSPLRALRFPNEGGVAQYYNGLTLVCGIINDPEDEQIDPQLVRMLGEGTIEVVGEQASGDGGFVFLLQRYGAGPGDRRAKFQGGFVAHRPGQVAERIGLDKSIPRAHISSDEHPEAVQACKHFLHTAMGDRWPRMYHDLVETLEPMQIFDLHQCPADAPLATEDSDLRLVSIGDALHGMSPTSGSGGNLAVSDAGDLATFLVEASLAGQMRDETWMRALRQREKAMLERSGPMAKRGMWNTARYKEISSTKGPVRAWFDSGSRFKGLGWRAETMFKAFQIAHRLEGWGGFRDSK